MLAKEGYRSLFVKKPVAPGMTFDPNLEDGCSLFYRVSPKPIGGAGGGGAWRKEAKADAGQDFNGRHSPGATAATTLDLLDAHTFTFAVVEEEDGVSVEGGAGGGGGDVGDATRPAEPVASNQVAMIALLGVSSGGGAGGDGDGDGGLVIVTTTHLKAAKDGHGEMIRARQVRSTGRNRRGRLHQNARRI